MADNTTTLNDNHYYLCNIGLNIQYYRKKKNLTQEQLSEMIGISRAFLSAIEAPNVDKVFSLPILFEICRVLEIEPVKLFEFD